MANEPGDGPVELVENETFGPDGIDIDGRHFVGCTFNGTRLVFSGGIVPRFDLCEFNGTAFDLQGSAERTIHFLRLLIVAGAKEVVDTLLTPDRSKLH